MAPTGFLPSRAAGTIYASLRDYERRTRKGFAFPDNTGFKVDLPNRESFSPDAAFHSGEPTGTKFLEGVSRRQIHGSGTGGDYPGAGRASSTAIWAARLAHWASWKGQRGSSLKGARTPTVALMASGQLRRSDSNTPLRVRR